MDTSKLDQATKIIASKIETLPTNAPMDHGTVGHSLGLTKREGEAYSMALYVVGRIANIRWTGHLRENMDQVEKDALDVVSQVAAAAVAITGK